MMTPLLFQRCRSGMLALFVVLTAASVARAQELAKAKVLQVLCIGNSQIFYNDLPRMVGALAESALAERPRIRADRFVAGGASLERLIPVAYFAKFLKKS
jgi:hypothetical protein